MYGVEWVWVIDPDERRALSYSATNPGGALLEELQTQSPDINLRLSDLLSVLDT
jgi:Uma2 family endonuclease